MKIVFRIVNFFVIVFAVVFTYLGFEKHQGNPFYYLAFSILVNLLFIYSLNTKRLFFEIFFATLIWLGFWFKYTMSIIYLKSLIYDSGPLANIVNIDKALVPSMVAISAVFFGYIIRQKFFSTETNYREEKSFFEKIYLDNKKLIICSFVVSFFIIAFFNFQLNIYQKGFIYPHGVSSIVTNFIKWMLLFGLTTFSSFFIYTEISRLKKFSALTTFVVFTEIFVSYSSMLSRALVLNHAAIAYSLTKFWDIIKNKIIFFLGIFILIIVMFLANNYFSNHYRLKYAIDIEAYIINQNLQKQQEAQKIQQQEQINENNQKSQEEKLDNSNLPEEKSFVSESTSENKTVFKVSNDPTVKPDPVNMSLFVVVNRWSGVDSMIAIVSSNKLSFDLFFQSLKEKKITDKHTFYESTFNVDWDGGKEVQFGEKRVLKGNTLPGIISFLFYSGNYYFLFFSMFFLTFIFSLLEILCVKISNKNMVFASFISYTIAFRLSNFGYAPADSYLYIVSIAASIILMYILSNYKGWDNKL